MPTQPIDIITEEATLEQLINELAKLQKMLRYLLNGQIDFENIRARSIKADNIEVGTLTAEEIKANTITAEKMNVTELSAIVADLGTITAGLLTAVNIVGSTITGGTFRTAESGERIEISLDSFKTYDSLGRFNGLILGDSSVNYGDADFYKNGTRYMSIFPVALPNPGMMIAAFNLNNLLIGDGNHDVIFAKWSDIVNAATSQTLQAALDAKATAGVSTDSYIQGDHNHGFPHGTVFTDKSGVDHTWNASGGFTHSHSQN